MCSWELHTKLSPSPFPAFAGGGKIEGHKRCPQSRHILIPADTGGSNGAQRCVWRQEPPRQLCDGLGLSVTVSHYHSGASKMESHRASPVQPDRQNWQAAPLDTYEKALRFIRTTTNTTGLKVAARLDTTYDPTGVKVSKRDLARLSIRQKRGECDEPLTSPLCDPLFGFHDVPQNIVDAGQVTLAL